MAEPDQPQEGEQPATPEDSPVSESSDQMPRHPLTDQRIEQLGISDAEAADSLLYPWAVDPFFGDVREVVASVTGRQDISLEEALRIAYGSPSTGRGGNAEIRDIIKSNIVQHLQHAPSIERRRRRRRVASQKEEKFSKRRRPPGV